MALYEYRCVDCAQQVTRRFPLGEAPATVPCPQCGSEAKRVWLSLRVIFRPEGWDAHPEDRRYWDTLEQAEREKQEQPSWRLR